MIQHLELDSEQISDLETLVEVKLKDLQVKQQEAYKLPYSTENRELVHGLDAQVGGYQILYDTLRSYRGQ